jgi:hypothetical protein
MNREEERSMVTANSIVVAAQDQVSSDLSGEAVILNLATGSYYGLDDVGARIWSLLQQPSSVDLIRDTIVGEYEVEPERCERDLLTLLEELEAAQLIEVRDAAGA